MKNKILLLIIPALLMSCEDYLDVNDDPNVPTETTIDLLLPAAQASIAVQVGGMLFNTGGYYAQYWTQAPEANQYNTVDKFDLKTDFLDNVYNELYSGALNDLERVRMDTEAEEDWGNYLVATVLRAYTYQLLVDLIDKTPYTEALQATDVLSPQFDDGSVVYNGIVSEIDAALAKVSGNENIISTDMLLGADIDEWIGFANALKLKIFMRQSETSNNHSSEVQALISEGNFFTQDVMFSSFADEQNKRNPWYETEVDRLGGINHVATINIISYLNSSSDPRLQSIWKPNTLEENYAGNLPGGKTIPGVLNQDFSFPNVAATMPVYLYTIAELKYFIAEAELRYNNDNAAAKLAYEEAIDAGLALHGLTGGTDLYGSGSSYEFDGTTNQIYMQKWATLAMVNHIESWFEIKRTEVPAISTASASQILDNGDLYTPGERIYPYENTLGAGKLIQRFYYPDIAVTRNTNTPTQVQLTDKVWWDVN